MKNSLHFYYFGMSRQIFETVELSIIIDSFKLIIILSAVKCLISLHNFKLLFIMVFQPNTKDKSLKKC